MSQQDKSSDKTPQKPDSLYMMNITWFEYTQEFR